MMKRNVIFVIVFAAIIVGLVKLHKSSISITDESKWTVVSIDEIMSIGYPTEIKERSDIPFGLLVDKEYKKSLPEDTNYELYKPRLIFLAQNFNEQNPVQLEAFSNIILNIRNAEPLDYNQLPDEVKQSILENIKTSIENNMQGTSYQITRWNELESYPMGSGVAFKASFDKQSELTNATMTTVVTYIFDQNREVEIILTALSSDANQWVPIYDKMVDSIVFK